MEYQDIIFFAITALVFVIAINFAFNRGRDAKLSASFDTKASSKVDPASFPASFDSDAPMKMFQVLGGGTLMVIQGQHIVVEPNFDTYRIKVIRKGEVVAEFGEAAGWGDMGNVC